jgi:Protein of unknown function (DUF4058)
MAGPFTGMDPYIECQGNWPDFHSRLIVEACNALGVQLPNDYVPRVAERIKVVSFNSPDEKSYRPDVLVARQGTPSVASSQLTGTEDTIKPLLIDVSDHDQEETRHTWPEIR